MSSVSYESAVLNAPIERVWALLRSMDQVWNPRVMSTRFGADFVIHTEPWAVGEVGVVNFVDGTAQDVRLTELSDANHTVSYEVVSSTPAVTYSSAQTTITCRRVTDSAVKGGATFVEWESHFSRDADANVIADAGFKAREALQALAAESRKTVSFHTTAEEAAAGFDLKGKTYLVTGGNSGIGFETVRVLALRGAHTVFTARDDAKIASTLAELKPLLPAAAGKVEGLVCALDSVKSVRAAAAAYRAKGYPLHGLILNAGVMACPYALTEDKLETQFGTNHVGHFVLTTQLLDVLKASAPSRVVAVSSVGHRFGGIRLDDPNFTVRPNEYSPFLAYGQSKTANILFAKQLNALLAKQGVKGVTANALHPGGIITNLARHLGDAFTTVAAQNAAKAHAAAGKDAKDFKAAAPAGPVHSPEVIAQTKQLFANYKFRLKTVPQGAATTIVAALHPEYAFGGKYGGQYLSDCVVTPVSAPYAEDMALAEKLWALTEKIVADIKA